MQEQDDWMIWGGTQAIADQRRIQSGRSVRMVGAFMTCTAMSGNGVRIGMVIMAVMQQIQKVRLRAVAVSCAAVAGTMGLVTALRPAGSVAARRARATTAPVSALLEHCQNEMRKRA